MTHKRLLTLLLATAGFFPLHATEADSLRVVDIETVTIVSQPKTHAPLRQQPLAASLVGAEMLKEHSVQSVKGLSGLTPNLFIPNYGSSLTSAIYIRGIGSRINSPAVGMYIDNIPLTEKAAFDFPFIGVERVDVLRGPQGTLYGRNTMGGLVMLHTTNPLRSPGVEAELGGATADMSHYGRGSLRLKFTDRTGLTFGFHANEARGIRRNLTTGHWAERKEGKGVSLRLLHLPTEELRTDFTLRYDQTDERGYPYQYNGPLTDDGGRFDHLIGKISNNRPHGYRRDLVNAAAHIQWQADAFTLSSVSSYQWLTDDMRIDQDFLADDIFTLRQRQRIHTLNQELTLKSPTRQRWQWVTGLSGMLQWTRADAPVDFYTDGVKMIQQAMDEGMKDAPVRVQLTDEHLHIPGLFHTPVRSIALFHQSDIRLTERLTLTAGLRLDHERQAIDYDTRTRVNTLFTGMGLVAQPGQKTVEYTGEFHKRQTHLLPRLALSLQTGIGRIYASATKGLRSGGYNMQMFSEIIQQSFRSSELTEAEVREQINYDPEWSLNYEVGTHLDLLEGALRMDAALFLIHTRDQQVSRFTPEGLGRILVNAGRARSMGGELSLQAQPLADLGLNLSYGYTHATFTRYDGGTSDAGEKNDYTGNRVPFAPEHTLSLGARYAIRLADNPLRINRITLRTDYQGAGRIWWTEANDAMQPYYGQLHAGLTLHFPWVELDLGGRNLTDTAYDTFRFHSMKRDFSQRGRPREVTVTVRTHLNPP